MYSLKLQMHKHGNSIYFMRDNMVCFPKSGHKCVFCKSCKHDYSYIHWKYNKFVEESHIQKFRQAKKGAKEVANESESSSGN